MKEDVSREIGILFDGKDKLDRSHRKSLEDIIKNHRLRTYLALDLAGLTTKT